MAEFVVNLLKRQIFLATLLAIAIMCIAAIIAAYFAYNDASKQK